MLLLVGSLVGALAPRHRHLLPEHTRNHLSHTIRTTPTDNRDLDLRLYVPALSILEPDLIDVESDSSAIYHNLWCTGLSGAVAIQVHVLYLQ